MTNNKYQLSVGTEKAYCIQTSDGFVLLKGSTIHKEAAISLNIGIKKKVEQCRINGEIVDDILQIDKVFTSSSSAAAFAAGYSISGPQQWKTESVKRSNLLKQKISRINQILYSKYTQNVLKSKNKTPKIHCLCGFRGFFSLFPLALDKHILNKFV